MAFWDDAKKKVLQVMKPRQQEEQQVLSNRADGGFSGYQPKVNRPQAGQAPTGFQQAAPAGFENMMPTGVDTSMMQQFRPVGGQTGAFAPQGAPAAQGMQPPQGNVPPQGMPQQPVNQPRPQAQFQGSMQQPPRPGFGQPAFRQNMPPQMPPQGNMPPQMPPQEAPQQMRGFTAAQPPVQPQPPVSNAPAGGNTFAFPGESFMVDGHAYKMVFRVAQITGVPSCFRVIEFMYNNEAVIVNAEQVTDLVEADRCMDLIFGAACAMKQRLMRVSGKQIYLITPPQVYVAPFDSLRRAGMADIERRWPGALQNNQPMMDRQPVVNNVQPMMSHPPMGQQPMPAGRPMQQTMFNQPVVQEQPRQDDFAGGFGRRAARNTMHTNGYTDYGGFGMKTR